MAHPDGELASSAELVSSACCNGCMELARPSSLADGMASNVQGMGVRSQTDRMASRSQAEVLPRVCGTHELC